jgi:hypothetical protein
MGNMSRWEVKMTKNTVSKLVYPLAVSVEGRSKVISVFDPKTKQVIKKSEKFTEKNFYEKYYSDPKFKELFDEAVEASVNYRIRVGYFREEIDGFSAPIELDDTLPTQELIDEIPQEELINYTETEQDYSMSE